MTHQIPPIPPGKAFARDTFWQRYSRDFAPGKTPSAKAVEWYSREKKRAEQRGKAFPPPPVFCPVQRAMPAPWDGKNEKPGRVPRG